MVAVRTRRKPALSRRRSPALVEGLAPRTVCQAARKQRSLPLGLEGSCCQSVSSANHCRVRVQSSPTAEPSLVVTAAKTQYFHEAPTGGFKMKAVAKCLLMLWFGTIAAHAQVLNFQHIVVIVQENRTPDNLFQGLCTSSSHLVKRCSTTPSSTQYNIQTG